MTKIGKIPKTCVHGGPIILTITPPTREIILTLEQGGKTFLDWKGKHSQADCGFYLFRPNIKNDDGSITENQLKKGDTVHVTIKAGDATSEGDVEVT